jgi:hypothetical protein
MSCRPRLVRRKRSLTSETPTHLAPRIATWCNAIFRRVRIARSRSSPPRAMARLPPLLCRRTAPVASQRNFALAPMRSVPSVCDFQYRQHRRRRLAAPRFGSSIHQPLCRALHYRSHPEQGGQETPRARLVKLPNFEIAEMDWTLINADWLQPHKVERLFIKTYNTSPA